VRIGDTGRTATVVRVLSATALSALVLAGCEADRSGDARPGAAGPLDGAPAAESAIADLFAAMNDHDADRALAHYHAGDDLVQVACTEVRRGHGRIAPMIRMWLEDQPEVAVQHQVIRSAALGEDGAVVAAMGRNQDGLALFWTFVLRRDEGGAWQIVQEHQSWPDCRAPRIHPMTG
jgi:ketosteroid isomerase-like protein